jgi:hypothetical protein
VESGSNNAQIESLGVSDIRVGDTDQRVRIGVSNVDPGTEADIYLDITSLTTAAVRIDTLGVVADVRVGSRGWAVTDAEIVDGKQGVVRVTVTVDTEDTVDAIGRLDVDLTGLQTTDGEHVSGLQHSVVLTPVGQDGIPEFTGGETASYAVIDPDELENELRVRPDDIRIGEEAQRIRCLIDHATDTIGVRVDLTPLTEAGVDTTTAALAVTDIDGERRNDEGEVVIDVTDTAVRDDIVRLNLTTTAETVAIDFQVTGLDTEAADPRDEVTYPVYTGDRSEEPSESSRFSISGAVA